LFYFKIRPSLTLTVTVDLQLFCNDHFSAGRVTGGSTAAIAGLTEKESNITDPWKQLYQLLQMVASRFQWKNDRVLLGDK
jgi:hypothetical protein